MAHELSIVDGRTEMFFKGQTPWHGLGTRLEGRVTSEEARRAAHLDWEIDLEPIFTQDGVCIPTHRVCRRSDNHDSLGVVGLGWQPFHNKDCFAFMDALVGAGGIDYHTAGALGKGERVWILAQLDGTIRVGKSDDHVAKFLLLSNNHDGRRAFRAFFTPIRVVCANTLRMAHDGAGNDAGCVIRHTGNLETKVSEAREVLGLAVEFYHGLDVTIQQLASVKPSATQLKTYFESLYPAPADPDKSKRAAENAKSTHNELERLFIEGAGHDMPGIARTWWTAYNAVTEFIDHAKPDSAKSKNLSSEVGKMRRLESNWFGDGAKVKEQAFGLALQMSAN